MFNDFAFSFSECRSFRPSIFLRAVNFVSLFFCNMGSDFVRTLDKPPSAFSAVLQRQHHDSPYIYIKLEKTQWLPLPDSDCRTEVHVNALVRLKSELRRRVAEDHTIGIGISPSRTTHVCTLHTALAVVDAAFDCKICSCSVRKPIKLKTSVDITPVLRHALAVLLTRRN